MSMTRKQAYDYLRDQIMNAHKFSNDHQTYHESLQALSILAPSPRKEPPTVKEVGDGELCLCCDGLDYWESYEGKEARNLWHVNGLIQWLPYSALPKGDV